LSVEIKIENLLLIFEKQLPPSALKASLEAGKCELKTFFPNIWYDTLWDLIVMSYPHLLNASCSIENFIIFTVPNQSVLEKIGQDSNQERDLRVKIAAKSLYPVMSELALLLSTHEAEIISSHEHSTLTIKLITSRSSKVANSDIEGKDFAMRRRIYLGNCRILNDCGIMGAPLTTIEEEEARDMH
jgi:hypothetical protein